MGLPSRALRLWRSAEATVWPFRFEPFGVQLIALPQSLASPTMVDQVADCVVNSAFFRPEICGWRWRPCVEMTVGVVRGVA